MHGSYSGSSDSYPTLTAAPPQPRSGLEAAISSTTSAYQSNPASSAASHAWRSYEARKQEAYAFTHMLSNPITQPYTVTTTSSSASAEAGKTNAEIEGAIYHSQPLAFLSPRRPRTRFVAAAADIAGFISEAFAKTTERELPENITITVAPRNALQMTHRLFFNQGIVGLSFNGGSEKEIFAVAGNLDEVMLVVGHELGHVLSPTLSSGQAEEAKAFAFEMAWANAIFTNDIAGLRSSINEAALSMKPAQNGLHDLAFAFVKAAALAGKEPLALHSEIAARQDFNIGFESEFQATAATAAAVAPVSYIPLISSTPHRASYHSGGYRNKSRVQNVPWMTNFSWADLGTGTYGMYIPLTASIFMNDRLLRTDLEQFHKTLGHEYVLHHVMQLPDNYVTKILEDTIFWVKDEEDKYKP